MPFFEEMGSSRMDSDSESNQQRSNRLGLFEASSNELPGLVGRLAPSPTGAQHLGNARTYLIAWLAARMQGATLLLRIEDLDTPRTKAWAFQQAEVDLRWLGLDWDIGPGSEPIGFPKLVQSQRIDRYREILEELKRLELIYPCTCTRSDIEEAQSAPHESLLDGAVYPGTCSSRNVAGAELLTANQVRFAWRLRMPDRVMKWEDRFAGSQSAQLQEDLGDFIVARSNGQPAYQLAVVVDDHDMKVTQVVRGDDLIPSTFRQWVLYDALEWERPAMYHLPLVVGTDGKRLAKRHGDTRLSSLREAGIPPETVLGYLAYLSGIVSNPHPIAPKELLRTANLADLSRNRLVFDSQNAITFFQNIMKR